MRLIISMCAVSTDTLTHTCYIVGEDGSIFIFGLVRGVDEEEKNEDDKTQNKQASEEGNSLILRALCLSSSSSPTLLFDCVHCLFSLLLPLSFRNAPFPFLTLYYSSSIFFFPPSLFPAFLPSSISPSFPSSFLIWFNMV